MVYEHADGDVYGQTGLTTPAGAPNGKTSLDSFQEVITGAKINF